MMRFLIQDEQGYRFAPITEVARAIGDFAMVDDDPPPDVVIPHGEKEIKDVYGDPGFTPGANGRLEYSPVWARKNGRMIEPEEMSGAYHRHLWVHRRVAESFLWVMRQSGKIGYRYDRIGCFAPRYKRHRVQYGPSTHAWAIAFDVNPETNKPFVPSIDDPRPWDSGWENRSSLSREVVDIWKRAGFSWGGDWRGFVDPMHFQLATGY